MSQEKYNPSKPEWTFLTKIYCCYLAGESVKTALCPSKTGLGLVSSYRNISMLQQLDMKNYQKIVEYDNAISRTTNKCVN